MALARPHVGMAILGIQTVAVTLILRVEHQILELLHAEGMGLAPLDHGGFKQEAAVDIHDHLRAVLQIAFQQGEQFLLGGTLTQRTRQQGFVEDGGRFRQRHGLVAHGQGQPLHAAVVPGMAQLMRQGAYIAQAAGKVGQHAALLAMGHARTERAAALALMREHIDPVVLKGVVDKLAHFGGEFAHFADQQRAGFLHGIGFPRLIPQMHGREKIIEGQAVLMAQQLALFAQILAERGQEFTAGLPHRIQRFSIHIGIEQRLIQDGIKAIGLQHRQALALDAVQARGHGLLDLRIGGQLGLIGIVAHLRIGILRLAAHGGQGQLFAAIIHAQGRVQLIAQLREGAAAGQGHFEQPLLDFGRGQMFSRRTILPQREIHRLQLLALSDRLLKRLVAQAAQIAREGRAGHSVRHILLHGAIHQLHSGSVVCIGRQGQRSILAVFVGLLPLFGKRHVLFQRFAHGQTLLQNGLLFNSNLIAAGKIALNLWIIKAFIEYAQIPIHFVFLLSINIYGWRRPPGRSACFRPDGAPSASSCQAGRASPADPPSGDAPGGRSNGAQCWRW